MSATRPRRDPWLGPIFAKRHWRFVGALALAGVGVTGSFYLVRAPIHPPYDPRLIQDVSRLVRIEVDRVVAPAGTEEVRQLLRSTEGPVSIGGGRFSMGGQIATEGATFIDARAKLTDVLELDAGSKRVRVEAGITWRRLQEAIDPHDLSVKVMQSYSNFTVGGTLSVNAHGRYVNLGPVVHSVRGIDLVLADGTLVRATRDENSELFWGAIGGYGGLGVITEAELDLVDNVKVERTVERLAVTGFKPWFDEHIGGSETAVFFNADLYPPEYDELVAITFSRTDRDVTVSDRLQSKQLSTPIDRFAYWLISEAPLGKKVRSKVIDKMRLAARPVVWRNHEASYDVGTLEPNSREETTYVLQEYFVPTEKFDSFVPKLRAVFTEYSVNVVNVSIRHAISDPGTLLAWAPRECFAFVVYYKQGTGAKDQQAVGVWTRAMIDEVLSEGGTFYLPYQLHATAEQFRAAYPRAEEFFALKKEVDPAYRFRNKLWDRYLPAGSATRSPE